MGLSLGPSRIRMFFIPLESAPKIKKSTKPEFFILHILERQKLALKFQGSNCWPSVQKVAQQIFGNIFLDYTWKIFFTLDDAVPGTRWPKSKKLALTTPKDCTMVGSKGSGSKPSSSSNQTDSWFNAHSFSCQGQLWPIGRYFFWLLVFECLALYHLK